MGTHNNIRGFTVLELLVVTAIIMAMAVTLVAGLAGITRNAAVTTAVQEMNNIKTAVADYFYPDLGFVPLDPGPDGLFSNGSTSTAGDDDRPWFATRYLCLDDDRSSTDDTPEKETAPYAYAMLMCLSAQINRSSPSDAVTTAKAKLTWNRYRQTGWRGPYMEYDKTVKLSSTETAAMPLIGTPWADTCEDMAQEAEDDGRDDEAEVLRRGKYYLIIADDTDAGSTDKTSARIISFGADCVDSGSYQKTDTATGDSSAVTAEDLKKTTENYDTGDDIVLFIFGGGAVRQPSSD